MPHVGAVILEHVTKCYGIGSQAVTALTDVSLCINEGEFVSVMGESGSGKSTLLNLIAGIDTPSGGRVVVAGQDLAQLSDDQRSDLRLQRIGFVFQSFNLFPTFSGEENVAWPLELLGIHRCEARRRADTVLARVGLDAAARARRPAELSAGEQQRVAIARALVTEPGLLLADEPTGNLDSKNGHAILYLLCMLNTERNLTVVLVTHSATAAAYGQRIVEVGDGRILRESTAALRPAQSGICQGAAKCLSAVRNTSISRADRLRAMRRNVCSFRMPLRFLRGHYGRRTLTVLALASGVSAMCANDLLSRAVFQAFGDVIDTTAGRTALQVSGAGGLFPQDTVATVAQVPGVAQAAGVVSATAFMTDESGELLTVHGLNLADATAARFYGVGGSPQRTLHDLRVLFPGSVLLTRSFATRRGLAVGDRLDLDTPSGRQTFTVRGLIDPQGLARLYQGNLIVMHLPAAEAAFTRPGYINRVDVLVQPGHEPADVANAIRAALPAGLRVEAPGYRKEYLARALWSMRVMLLGSALSILVTAFLIAFNSLATLFEARAWQLGVLRAVGVRPRAVWRELVKEGLVLGVFGVGLGIPAGIANAHVFLPMIATAAALNSKLLTPEAALVIHGSSLALAAGTGLAAAFLAAALPAWRAAQRGVAETVRGRGTEQPGIGAGSRWLILGVVAAAAAFAIAVQVIMHSALWGVAATGLIALTTTLAARPLIRLLGPPLLGGLTLLAGPPARLAAANLTRNPRRTALMVATIGVGLGSVLWLRIVAQSFERSVIDILTEAIRADLIVSSAHFESSLLEAPVEDRLVSQLEDIPGVAAAAAVRVTEWQHAGGPITVNAYDPAYFTDPTFGRWPLLGEQSPDAWHAVARGAAAVISSNFAQNLQVRVGDTVTLATPSGPLPLRVAGITTQFVSPRGTLFMSRDLYARSWNDNQVTRVYVRAADRADIAALRSAIAHTLGRTYALRILSSRALVEYFATQVRRAFAGVYILAASILFVVLIGMAETLAAGVIARTREIGAIRVVGVRRRHLRSMVLVEGLALGTVGLVLAAASGFVQGTLWVKATFPCLFGWAFDRHVPYFDAGLVAVLTLAVCLAAALLPAHRAARLDPATALRDE